MKDRCAIIVGGRLFEVVTDDDVGEWRLYVHGPACSFDDLRECLTGELAPSGEPAVLESWQARINRLAGA